MIKIMSIILAAVMSISILASCTGNAYSVSNSSEAKTPVFKENINVVFIPKLTENAFFDAANEGAQEYAAKIGFHVKYDGSPDASVQNQIAVIDNAVKDGADAICISSVDAMGLDDTLKKAAAAGLKIVTWDSDVSADTRTVMVSQGTPEILGKMLVDMSVKSLAERGKKPNSDPIKYAWHYSQASVADQNSWQAAGEAYIRESYPRWVNIEPNNYYSEQNASKAVEVGELILSDHKDIDLIICNDSTALPGQCQAAQNLGFNKEDVTITGFSSPNSIKDFCKAGIIERWGLWDCKVQGALGCYLAYYLASGNTLNVGDTLDVPDIGKIQVLPNTVLILNAYTASDSGVVLLPERVEFTIDNVDEYDF